MYDLFRLPTYQHLCALGGFFSCLLFGFQVNAQTVAAPDSAFQRFMWTTTGANSQSVAVGTGGTLIASPTGSGTLAADGSKTLAYTRPSTWRNGSNNPVTGSIASRIPIDAKTARVLSKGMKAVPFLGTGVALWEMAQELNVDVKKDANGELTATKYSPFDCFTAPCFQYRMNDSSAWNRSALVVANQIAAATTATSSRRFAFHAWLDTNYTRAQFATYNKSGDTTTIQGFQNFDIQRTSVAPMPVGSAGEVITIEQLEAEIAAKSGWPSTSKLPRAVTDATSATGEQVIPEIPRITGPATSPGTTSTTTNPTNNTTTTNTVTHDHTYNDNRVTNTITRASTVTNNATGAATTTTTTEQPVEEPSDCEKNPGSIGCAELDTPTGEIPKAEKRVSYQAENLGFGGGSCPSNVVMTPANMATPITVINWADNCQKITTYAKPMILAMALFAAMMIIFVGKTE